MAEDGIFVNTGFLREHVLKLRTEKKIALELRENVEAMKYLVELDELYKIQAILRDIDMMIDYFEKMADSMDTIGNEAVYLSRTIGGIVQDDTDATKSVVSKEIAL